jgi:nicotinate-nucleotide pyrophosphorylase (carboxylating)
VTKGTYFGTVTGSAHSLLRAERLALNLMQRMSGIATLTHAMVRECKGTSCKVLDTRKTVPGLRDLDKLAVRSGGGTNHRFGLHDMVMIKDNHITAAGGVVPAIEAAKAYLAASPARTHIAIEVEARTLEEVKLVVAEGGIQRILLDNMVKVTRGSDGAVRHIDTSMLSQALGIVNGAFDTEASGNVMLDTVGAIARTGVTHVSCGALTHSVMALDISLKIKLLKLASRL